MAEVLVEFSDPVVSETGVAYNARACGGPMPGGTWQGWIEFTSAEAGGAIRTQRETTQPNRQDTSYWATGLTAVYLEGALERALAPRLEPPVAPSSVPAFDEPAPTHANGAAPAPGSVLNPFSVYQKGETVLRRQLAALSAWHLVNIVTAHGLSAHSAPELSLRSDGELIELIVTAVKLKVDPLPAK